MYKLTIKNGEMFTIPKQNLRFLAISKAIDLKQNIELKTEEQAIDFLNKLGIEVEE